ncbi:MAG: Ku protein [Bdellovibrionota bacterium]
MRSDIWKGSISFGLLNIPVGLRTAQEDKELHFHMLDGRDMSPIKYKKINESSGKEVPYERIVKAYEYEKGEYVVMEAEDFKKANPVATQAIDIEDFVLLEEIDPILFDKPYYIVPQKNGEKGYFLLRDALEKTKKVAVGKVVIRTKQHLAIIMPKDEYLVLQMLRFPHTVKETHEVDYLSDKKQPVVSRKELQMAEKLIADMTDKWHPDKYRDTYYDDLLKRIKQKVKNNEGKHIEDQDDEKEIKLKPSDAKDLLALLQQSLNGKKTGGSKKASSKGTKKAAHRPPPKSKSPERNRARLH